MEGFGFESRLQRFTAMVSCPTVNTTPKPPDVPWLESLEDERANEAMAILHAILERMDAGDPIRIEAYSEDSPATLALGSEEYWIERRARVVRALGHKGFLRSADRLTLGGPLVADYERGEWITIDADEAVVRMAKMTLEERKRKAVVGQWIGKRDKVTRALPNRPEVVDQLMKAGAVKSQDYPSGPAQLGILRTILRRFHLVAKELRTRRAGRPPFEISDEYDVQGLLRALLRVHVGDIRPEETTPSLGGASARVDFFLKTEGVVIEAKMTRDNLRNTELVKQINDDIQKYRRMPGVKRLMVLVYDPEHQVSNPEGFESDYLQAAADFSHEVLVVPKGL